jgi:hypothetical protein
MEATLKLLGGNLVFFGYKTPARRLQVILMVRGEIILRLLGSVLDDQRSRHLQKGLMQWFRKLPYSTTRAGLVRPQLRLI